MNNFGNTNLFDKIIPKTDDYDSDMKQCDDHKSFATFRQGIFDVSGFSTDKYWEIHSFFEAINPIYNKPNKECIERIECYLLKHPLFNFPIAFYPLFQFVHHSQIGFKFIDTNGNTIRHMTIQLQNSWYPTTSDTVPFDVPSTCKRVNISKDGTVSDSSSDIIVLLNDKTAIYADFLENDNYTSDAIIEMNKYTYLKGINLNFLQDTVNFNFLLESYRIWRYLNTNTADSSGSIPPVIREFETLTCSSTGSKCGGGPGDGSLFVFNTFSPAFLSKNEGCILNFANIQGESSKISSKFLDFTKWIYSNLYNSKTKETYINSFTKHYITLSTSMLSYDWALNSGKDNADDINILFSKMRDGTWLNEKGWGVDSSNIDPSCAVFDNLMTSIATSSNLVQAKSSNSLNDSSCPFLCQGENYTCETFSRFLVTMIMNDTTWSDSSNAVNIDKLFDFELPGKSEKDMTFENNLFRSYSMYWPVAIYDLGYENGVKESDFNTKNTFKNDKILYAKQSQLFKYLFKGQFIEAAKVTGNPFMAIVADFLGLPLFNSLVTALTSGSASAGFSTVISVISGLLYALFLYKFLGVEEVFVAGYPIRQIQLHKDNNYSVSWVTEYDCEPSIYKFQIGTKSRAAIANTKCIEAYLAWIKNGKTPDDIFQTISSSNDPILQQIHQKIIDGYDKVNSYINSGNSNNSSSAKCSAWPFGKDLCVSVYNAINDVNGFKNIATGAIDILDAMLLLVKNPGEIPKVLLTEFANFLGTFGNEVYILLTVFMTRFTTICHQNYTLDPQVMNQRQTNVNNTYQFADFNRPSSGICGSLQGKLTISLQDITNQTTIHPVSRKPISNKFNAKYNILNPYEQREPNPDKWFHITLVICIIVVILVLLYMAYKKNNKK